MQPHSASSFGSEMMYTDGEYGFILVLPSLGRSLGGSVSLLLSVQVSQAPFHCSSELELSLTSPLSPSLMTRHKSYDSVIVSVHRNSHLYGEENEF